MEEAGKPGVSGVAATGARPQGTLGGPEEAKGPNQERPTARLGVRSGSVHSSAQSSVTSLRHAADWIGRGWNGRVLSCLQGEMGSAYGDTRRCSDLGLEHLPVALSLQVWWIIVR